MKMIYGAIGVAVVIGIGIGVYKIYKSKTNIDCKVKSAEKTMPTINNNCENESTNDSIIKASMKQITKQHQVANDIIRDTFEEIKEKNVATEQSKQEIQDLLNELNK